MKFYKKNTNFSLSTISKKQILFFSTLSFLTILFFLYLNQINIYEPLEIKTTYNGIHLDSNLKVIGIKPIHGEDIIKYDNNTESWKFEKGYFRKIIIHILPSKPEITSLNISIKTNDNIEIYNKTKTVINNTIEIKDIGNGNIIDKLIFVLKTNIEKFQNIFFFLLIITTVYLLSKTKKTPIFNKIMLIGILLYGVFCLIIPAFFSFPNAEDLSLVVMAKKTSIINGVIQPLVTFDGRYFTNLLHSISPIAWGGIELYKYVILFSIILTYFSHFLFIKTFPLFKKKSAYIILFPSIFIFSHFAIIPSIVHELYWMASSFVYLWSWNFFLIWFSLFWLMLKTNHPPKKISYFILSFIFLVCSYGLNEMMIIVNVLSLFGYLIYIFKNEKLQLIHLIPFAMISIVCIYFFISSPGIQYRLDSAEVTRDFGYYLNVLQKGSIYIFSTTYKWLLNNTLIIPFSIIISYLLIDTPFKISNKILISLIFVFVSLLYILPFLYFIPMGVEYYPERIFNFTNWFFLVILFLLIPLLITNNIKTIRQKALKIKPLIVHTSILLIIAYLIFSTNNFGLIIHEYSSGEYKEYKKEMENRYRIIEIAKQNKVWSSASIDLIKHKPSTIYTNVEILPNRAEDFWNKSYEDYFNIDEIKIKNDTISKINSIIENVKK